MTIEIGSGIQIIKPPQETAGGKRSKKTKFREPVRMETVDSL